MKYFYIFLLATGSFWLPVSASAQLKTYQFEEIGSLQKIKKRNVAVFIHTDWCKYCKTMLNTTLKNDSIIKILNDKFYFIDLNAEERRIISFAGKHFQYKPTGSNTGINELAEQLGNVDNKVSYPTFCFLNSNYEIIYQHTQYINHSGLLKILSRL